jgi:hypothetical protein
MVKRGSEVEFAARRVVGAVVERYWRVLRLSVCVKVRSGRGEGKEPYDFSSSAW